MSEQNFLLYLKKAVESQMHLQHDRNEISEHSAFSYFRVITPLPCISALSLKSFIASFAPRLSCKAVVSAVEMLPQVQQSLQDRLQQAVQLLLFDFGGKMNLQQFSTFIRGTAELPAHPRDISFTLKKKLFQLLQRQLQGKLDAEALKRTINVEYEDINTLFHQIAKNPQQCISLREIQNLFLAAGERKSLQFYQMLGRRFKMPCNSEEFKKMLQTKVRGSIKIHYSESRHRNINSASPSKKKPMKQFDSTKATKVGVEHRVSEFNDGVNASDDVSAFTMGWKNILGEIIIIEERMDEIKAKIVFKKDFDLELMYYHLGRTFENVLNSKYGNCNFTSFVRFIVPRNWEHHYYVFIKQAKTITTETKNQIQFLLQEQMRAEEHISSLWSQCDREMLFRQYCKPNQTNIQCTTIQKHFTKRECERIFDRMDPHKTKQITFDRFK